MSAFLKVYTDSGHTTEVAHTTGAALQMNAVVAGATTLTFTTVPSIPTQGTIDIVDGTNGNETLTYYGLSGSTVNLGSATAHLHPANTVVNQWYYSLPVGDQVNGIPNDGTASTPVAANTAAFYLYNAGDQTAQSPSLATASGAPSTASGFADTKVSITSSTTGFAASVSPANIVSGAAATEFWVVAEIPNGQSAAGNPQVCEIDISYSSI